MEQEPDIMEKTGLNNKMFVTTEGVFLNSKVLFVEYEDVIKSPLFSYLYLAESNEKFSSIFKTDELHGLSLEDMYKWYIERDEKNVFRSLEPTEDFLSKIGNDKEKLDEITSSLYCQAYNDSIDIIKTSGYLNFDKILLALLGESKKSKMAKNILVWHPFYNKGIDDELTERYFGNVKFVYGDLKEVLKEHKVDNDSTFIFSDMYHILELEELELLNCSSIIIADEYWYNYDDKFEPIIDLEELLTTHVIKLDFFDNISNLQ